MKSLYSILCTVLFATIFHRASVISKITYNTLPRQEYRSTPYTPFVIDKTCLLKPDIGPCRGNINMYYYDPQSRNCSRFKWGGCQGNGNRFDTHEDCMESCVSKPNPPNVPPKWCRLSFDYGFCFGSSQRWYYDPLWKVCKSRIYSGCGGNKNNFYNQEQCESVCRFGRGFIKPPRKSQGGLKKILLLNPKSTRKGHNTHTTPSYYISTNATNTTLAN